MVVSISLHDGAGNELRVEIAEKIPKVITLIQLGHLSKAVVKQFSVTAVYVAILMGAAFTTTTVYAGADWKDSCRDAGYDDGQKEPFSQ